MNNIKLSPEQENIVHDWTNNGGAVLIQACAGSGKTAVLTECVNILLEASRKEHYKILCLTFTNKAADEMKQRLKKSDHIEESTFIGTIHSFALNLFKSHRYEIGYEKMPTIIENLADRKQILFEILTENSFAVEKLQSYMDFICTQKKNLVFINDENIHNYSDWEEDKLKVFMDYDQVLKNQNLIDYEDILLLAWRILNEVPIIANNIYQKLYKYILIDEAQDLSKAQYEFIKILAGNKIKNILMVGDSNQSINGFANSNQNYMLKEFPKDFNAITKELNKNYRSSEQILNLANSLDNKKDEIINNYFKGKIIIQSFNNEEYEAKFILNEIKSILKHGYIEEGHEPIKIDLSNISVLGRTQYIFKELIELLNQDEELKNQYYFKQSNYTITFESNLIKIFDLGTRILQNSKADVYIKQMLAILKLDNNVYKEVLKHDKPLEKLKCIILKSNINEALINQWKILQENDDKLDICLTNIQNIVDDLPNQEEKELINNDIEEFKRLYKEYCNKSPSNITRSLDNFRRYSALGYSNILENKITLSTVHSAKGLEFEAVFLMGMTQGTFPDYRANSEEEKAQEKNNFYVAVTRAKKLLYISYPMSKETRFGAKSQEASEFYKSVANFLKNSPNLNNVDLTRDKSTKTTDIDL